MPAHEILHYIESHISFLRMGVLLCVVREVMCQSIIREWFKVIALAYFAKQYTTQKIISGLIIYQPSAISCSSSMAIKIDALNITHFTKNAGSNGTISGTNIQNEKFGMLLHYTAN